MRPCREHDREQRQRHCLRVDRAMNGRCSAVPASSSMAVSRQPAPCRRQADRGRSMSVLRVLAALLWLVAAVAPVRAADVPFLSGRVVDEAEVLARRGASGCGAAEGARAEDHQPVVVLTVRRSPGKHRGIRLARVRRLELGRSDTNNACSSSSCRRSPDAHRGRLRLEERSPTW